jgi:hypothetical protein
MAAPQNIIAVIFDFDDTLTDDSTTQLLESRGIDTNDFWKNKLPAKMADGWDPALAYLSMFLQLVGKDKPLGFTEKTRFIFEINKGLGADGSDTRTNPYDVNIDRPSANRRIPLENMIYVGDGLTDVPCFSLLKKCGGHGFGVVDPLKKGKPKEHRRSGTAVGVTNAARAPGRGGTADVRFFSENAHLKPAPSRRVA